MGIASPDPNLWDELKKSPQASEGSGEFLYGGMVSDLLPYVHQPYYTL